jgi:hypothetical protein
MRDKGIDFFENSRRATYVQRQYAIANPLGFEGYSASCWGPTASHGPATEQIKRVEHQFFGDVPRGVHYGSGDETITPSAIVASLPFAPQIVLPAVDYVIDEQKLHHVNPYEFRATTNPTYVRTPIQAGGWVSPRYFGINQGPMLLMLENHRSGLLRDLMRACPYIVNGLKRADFRGDRL